MSEEFNFSVALELLKKGNAVTRKYWKNAGIFIYLVPAASYPALTEVAKKHFGENSLVPYSPYFAINKSDNTVSPWTITTDSCLAEDWCKVNI